MSFVRFAPHLGVDTFLITACDFLRLPLRSKTAKSASVSLLLRRLVSKLHFPQTHNTARDQQRTLYLVPANDSCEPHIPRLLIMQAEPPLQQTTCFFFRDMFHALFALCAEVFVMSFA